MKKAFNTDLLLPIIFCAGLAGMIAGWTGCKPSPGGDAGQADIPAGDSTGMIYLTRAQMADAGMSTGPLERHTFHAGIDVYGAIRVPPDARASVHAYFGGYVREVRVLNGQRVRRGDVLFSLEHPEYLTMQQAYLSARDELAFLESDYARQKGLAEEKVASQKSFSKAETEFHVMQTKKEALAGQLRMMGIDPDRLTSDAMRSVITVPAPIDGYVGDLSITRGMYLDASIAAATILNTDAQYAEFQVFEKDLHNIRPGQSIRFHLLTNQSTTYEATVLLTGRQIDPEHKTIPVHARLRDAKQASRFSPGMYIEGFIETSSDSAFALPNTAVVEAEGKFFALRVEREEGDRILLRQVELQLGKRDEEYVEIRNAGGFSPSDIFLTKGAYTLIQ